MFFLHIQGGILMLELIYDIIFRFFPIQQNLVFLNCFNGQYNDNPKYIGICLHKQMPELNFV